MQILIIDSAVQTGRRIKSLLRSDAQFSVITQANDLNEGLHGIQKEKPGIVILDAGSYGPSGLQSIKKLKSNLVSSILIMFTNYTHSMYKSACMQIGVDFFFDKTTEFDQLIELLESIRFNKGMNQQAE